MSVQDHSLHEQPTQLGSTKSRAGLVLIGFLIIAGALLFTEHRAHVLGLLIWLPLLACPLMHVFMHGGHGHHGGHDQPKDQRSAS
jgi:DUF2933 family protein